MTRPLGNEINRHPTWEVVDLLDEIKAGSLQLTAAPLSTPLTTNVTLTDADTDYRLPSSEKAGRRTIVVSNNSAYDIYIGQTGVIDCDASPPIGILVPAGGTFSIDCSSGLYAQCDTAGAKITVTEF